MASEQGQCFLDISNNGHPVVIQNNCFQLTQSSMIAPMEQMSPKENFGTPSQVLSIGNFQPILHGYEDFFDVPYNEFTQAWSRSVGNIDNLQYNLNNLTHTEIQTHEHVYDQFMFETPTDGFPTYYQQNYSSQDSAEHRYNNIDSTISVRGTIPSDFTPNPVNVSSMSGSRPIAVISYKPAQPVQVLIDHELRSCDNRNMMVQASDQSSKRYFCIYCKKMFAKLARHLELVHKNEDEIKKLHASAGKERRKILDDLRKKGSFEFNTNPTYNNGFLLTSRRPNPQKLKTAEKFEVCFNCRGHYAESYLRHHVKTCSENALAGERIVLQLSRIVERRVHAKASDLLVNRMCKMLKDDITRLVKFDWLLITFGNKIVHRFMEDYQHKIVRQKLRLAGRILYQCKSICTEINDFASIYKPNRYDQLVTAIRMVGSFDPETNHYDSPSTSSDAVTLIREICSVLVAEYIKQDNQEEQRITENFLKVMNSDISDAINKPVINAKAARQLEREERIPTTEDVKLFAKHIFTQRKVYLSELKKEFSVPVWRKLSEMTMASIIVFNKRRIGEIENMLVAYFNRRKTLRESFPDQFQKLSDGDKVIAERYRLARIRGKKGRPVPVLINPGVEECLNLMLRHRNDAGILKGNNRMFALPSKIENSQRHINAGTVLFQLSKACGAKDPETLRGTKIRKHMASMSIAMELGDNAVSELCDFLGHNEPVHRKHYRVNPMERQVIQISQLLEAATGAYDEDETGSMNAVDSTNQNQELPSITHSNYATESPAAQHSLEVSASTGRKRKQVVSANGPTAKSKIRLNQQKKSVVCKMGRPNKSKPASNQLKLV